MYIIKMKSERPVAILEYFSAEVGLQMKSTLIIIVKFPSQFCVT